MRETIDGLTVNKFFEVYMKKLFVIIVLITCLSISGAAQSKDTTFRISTSYKNYLSNLEQTGMLDRILKEAFRRIGLNAEIVFTPTLKSLFDVNAGLLDAEINRIAGIEKSFPNLVRVPEPNMIMQFVAFSKKDFEISDWESLRGLQIGIVKGWKILEENTEGFPNVFLLPTETELFRMLDMGRLDIVLYSKLAGYEQLKILQCDGVRHLEPPLASREMFLYLHKKYEELVEPVAGALRQMKLDGTYDAIVSNAI